MPGDATLWAVSDLHVSYRENRALLERIRPGSDRDWLIVAGDVADLAGDVVDTLRLLRERFAAVLWVPGNHELWTTREDPLQLRGVARYDWLVEACRDIDVGTPEDDYPVWPGSGGPARVIPLFLLYDYSFLTPGTTSAQASLARAYEAGVVCADENLLHPDPYPGRAEWCAARVADAERRLAACPRDLPWVLVNHWPLHREPTLVLTHPEFAQWCGTERTSDWHTRFPVAVTVYGHLHIPRTMWHDGVRSEEVSLGYPREWRRHGLRPGIVASILPASPA
ncbi:MAG: metallophosphoesterase [Geodermatophilaceae bacterium]|nr:metallophosphoesterase [Geodermatophilaceae bacterium]